MALAHDQYDWKDLAQTLADGFESLLKEAEKLSKRERDLDSRLKFAFDEYVKVASDPLMNNEKAIEHEVIARRILKEEVQEQVDEYADAVHLHLPQYLDGIEEIRKGFQAFKSIKRQHSIVSQNAQGCTFPNKHDRSNSLEQDFTTQGIQGDLGCPFARRLQQSNGVPTPPQDGEGFDPIAVEFHPEFRSLVTVEETPSVAASAGKCPIRYLSQHSPEEVAQYFENHKHEIPRSHEICVKRYQKNSESIRELDSKYGNLVSMIQGLGVKHQQFLPNKEGEQDIERGQSSTDAVSKWADEISRPSEGINGAGIGSNTSPSVAIHDDEVDDDQRSPRFQRPLREIRVGESPSRPWGISVPIAMDRPLSPETAPVEPRLFRHSEASNDQHHMPHQSLHAETRTPPTQQPFPLPDQHQHTPTPQALHDPAKLTQPNFGHNTVKKCPFDHTAGKAKPSLNLKNPQIPTFSPNPASHPTQSHLHSQPEPRQTAMSPTQSQNRHPSPTASLGPPQPTMIFHGPVFFGYNAEQAAGMMRNFRSSTPHPQQ